MDIQKIRYDLALQTAVLRLEASQANEPRKNYTCEELLGILSVCYSECLEIPADDIRASFKRE
jgi:hypothetical protein